MTSYDLEQKHDPCQCEHFLRNLEPGSRETELQVSSGNGICLKSWDVALGVGWVREVLWGWGAATLVGVGRAKAFNEEKDLVHI